MNNINFAARSLLVGTGIFLVGTVAFVVAVGGVVPLAFAGGIIAAPFLLVVGLPYLAYRNYTIKKGTNDLRSILGKISNISGITIGGRSPLDRASNFYTEGELKSLYEIREKINLEIESISEEHMFDKAKVLILLITLLILPIIGLIAVVFMMTSLPNGRRLAPRIRDHTWPQLLSIHRTDDDVRNLDRHIDLTKARIARRKLVHSMAEIKNWKLAPVIEDNLNIILGYSPKKNLPSDDPDPSEDDSKVD